MNIHTASMIGLVLLVLGGVLLKSSAPEHRRGNHDIGLVLIYIGLGLTVGGALVNR